MADGPTTSQPPGTRGGESLQELLINAGFGVDPRVRDLQAFAGAVQQQRFDANVSDTPDVTRSTALWSLTQLDQSIRTVLVDAGVDLRRLQSALRITTTPSPWTDPDRGKVHADFSDALHSYLRELPRGRSIGPADIASAILLSSRDPSQGLLPSRLGRFDYASAMASLDALKHADDTTVSKDDDDFSDSVQRARASLADSERVTAGQIATALQALHGEYAGGLLRGASFGTGGVARPFEEWMALVRDRYDMASVRSSKKHGVIDGRLFLMALYHLDPQLAIDLTTAGVPEQLSTEIDVRPLVETMVADEQSSTAPTDPGLGADTEPAPVPLGPLAGGITGDLVDPNQGIPLSEDHLGVGPYVSMLGSVITDVHTPMPLSVGIFGEWGSGKSYFMGLLRQKITDLSRSEVETYHREVVQIGFNAWHYADTNLWASLGDEIFRALFGTGEGVEERQARLRQELSGLIGQRKDLQADSHLAQREAARLREDLERASAQREARAGDLLEAVMRSPALGESAKKAWRRLGVPDLADQRRLLSEELNGAITAGTAIRVSLAGRRVSIAVLTAAAALAIFAIAVLVPLIPVDWLLRGGAATVTAFLAGTVAVVARARSGLELLRGVADQLRADVDAAADEREQRELAPLVIAVRNAEAKEADAQAQLSQVVTRVETLERELAELSPGRRLYSFLTERAASDDYSRNLGIISTIRKDFQELVQLMAAWKSGRGAEKTPRPIDRIVLYIDDLDRCSPRQVVDVLQAVHLLLALDLFVVVVGVDPRWLLRSLQREYPLLLDNPESADKDDGWWVSPEDYLEKIFNIPLVLPGMTSGSLGRIIDGILRKDVAQLGAAPSPGADADVTVSLVPPADRTGPEPTPGPSRPTVGDLVEPGSEVASQAAPGATAPPRPLTTAEISLLTALEELIPTPREATRLLNLYRMVRSTRDLADESLFLGDDTSPGEYQAVIVLLGLLTAHARLLGQVLDTPPRPDQGVLGGLMHRPAGETWSAFVDGMKPVRRDAGWKNALVGPLPDPDVSGWHVLATGLRHASSQVALLDLSAFHVWAPRIRRFSFVLSPLAMPVDAPAGVGAENEDDNSTSGGA